MQIASNGCVYSKHHIHLCIVHSLIVVQTLCICLFLPSLRTFCDLTPKPTSIQSQNLVFFHLRLGFLPSFYSILLTNFEKIIFPQTKSNLTLAASNLHKEATTGCNITQQLWDVSKLWRNYAGFGNHHKLIYKQKRWQFKNKHLICIPCWMRTSIFA